MRTRHRTRPSLTANAVTSPVRDGQIKAPSRKAIVPSTASSSGVCQRISPVLRSSATTSPCALRLEWTTSPFPAPATTRSPASVTGAKDGLRHGRAPGDARELLVAQLLVGLAADRDNRVAIATAADVDGAAVVDGRRAFRVVDGLAPELLAVVDADGDDEARIADRFSVLAFDRSRAHHGHVSQDCRRRLDVQRRLHRPAQLARRRVEAQQRAIAIRVQALADHQVFPVARQGRRAEERTQVLARRLRDLPEGLAGLGVDAGQQAGVAAQVGLTAGREDPFSGHRRAGKEHRVLGAVAPQRLEPQRRRPALVATAGKVAPEHQRGVRRSVEGLWRWEPFRYAPAR